jgi:hypothetical protein
MLTKATVRGLACEYGVCNRYAGVTVLQRNRLKKRQSRALCHRVGAELASCATVGSALHSSSGSNSRLRGVGAMLNQDPKWKSRIKGL